MQIRQADLADTVQVKELFKQTILTVNRKDYTLAQCAAWAARGDIPKMWEECIAKQYFIVATDNEKIIGFCAIETNGYLHLMYIHKDFQGRGIATTLLNTIYQYAQENHIKKITTEVSITALPFFLHNEFTVICEQTVDIGIRMTNYRMERTLL